MKFISRILSLALIFSLINPSIHAANWKSKALAGTMIGLGSAGILSGLAFGLVGIKLHLQSKMINKESWNTYWQKQVNEYSNYQFLKKFYEEILKITDAHQREEEIKKIKYAAILSFITSAGFFSLGTCAIVSGIKNLKHMSNTSARVIKVPVCDYPQQKVYTV